MLIMQFRIQKNYKLNKGVEKFERTATFNYKKSWSDKKL